MTTRPLSIELEIAGRYGTQLLQAQDPERVAKLEQENKDLRMALSSEISKSGEVIQALQLEIRQLKEEHVQELEKCRNVEKEHVKKTNELSRELKRASQELARLTESEKTLRQMQAKIVRERLETMSQAKKMNQAGLSNDALEERNRELQNLVDLRDREIQDLTNKLKLESEALRELEDNISEVTERYQRDADERSNQVQTMTVLFEDLKIQIRSQQDTIKELEDEVAYYQAMNPSLEPPAKNTMDGLYTEKRQLTKSTLWHG